MVNKLILGDNLEILKAMDSETVDLIYLDPPFFSNRNYEVIWGDEGEVRSSQDRWAGGMEHYIAWLKERVEQMYRVLKPAGSLFLHCDWHVNAYIRVDIPDRIFGRNNFRNEIIWCYTGPTNTKNYFPRKHDKIFYYAKNRDLVGFNISDIRVDYKAPFTAARGLHGKKDYEEARQSGRHEAGKIPEDRWADMSNVSAWRDEQIGYPTQKPMALPERIIKCGSNEGDLVLDPFMGGGTAIVVADRLNRKWAGIDQSMQAVKVTELRLHRQTDLFTDIYANSYTLQLHKYDYDTLRNRDAFEFETWIIGQFGGTANAKQRSDFGIDGKKPDGTPIQVKRSENAGRNIIDNFLSAVKRADKKRFDKNAAAGKPVGYIIAFSFGKGAIEEVARLKMKENIVIELVRVDTIIPLSKKPTGRIEVNDLPRCAAGARKIEFTATAESHTDINFYSWDFAYSAEKGFKPIVIRDLAGKQTAAFKAGRHNIAVKAVDNNDLESVEMITLKINGEVEQTN
jgi:DNA modification methylase